MLGEAITREQIDIPMADTGNGFVAAFAHEQLITFIVVAVETQLAQRAR